MSVDFQTSLFDLGPGAPEVAAPAASGGASAPAGGVGGADMGSPWGAAADDAHGPGATSPDAPSPWLGPLGATVQRRPLSRGAWVDLRPGWVGASEDLFVRLVREVPWHAERRQMWDREVAVPRLLKFYDAHETWPDPLLPAMRDALGAHYAAELGEPFTTAGLCYYRDGRDSVAWHGDRIGRSRTEDTMVAIVSLGEARRLSLRPRTGGPSMSFALGHGDLLVMGGSCQRTWEHAVLKTARPVGPRISIQFRPHHVR